jgi:carboxymethylenebutenolidase
MSSLRQYLIGEFMEDYEEGLMSRRDALRHIAAIVGSVTVATSILAACTPPAAEPAESPVPSPTTIVTPAAESAMDARNIEFTGQAGRLMGYLARPAGSGPFPGVLVCHENRGLTEHIRDVTRRVANAGYVGLAVDLLSREGGTEAVAPTNLSRILGNEADARFVQDFQDGMKYLQSQSYVRGDRIGMTGFCFGGGVTWLVATKTPELKAAVPYYGSSPDNIDDVQHIQAPVLGIYGELDNRINQDLPDTQAAMARYNKTFVWVIYPGARHAFHNDTGASYNEEAAKAAWTRTLEWFDRYLRA